ncbi:MAG: hypothetical protein DRJ42_22865 [Deltaproteobacteria bacterium]|nr:MAG: hypothetical protein DRJ42_22865 [Deltaproteobacteria bacterium]
MKWLLPTLMVLSACSSETAILVEIDSTLGVPAEVDQLDIVAVGANSGGMLVSSSVIDAPFPHSFSIRPKNDDSEEVTITVTARKRGDVSMTVGALVTERTVVTRFVPGEVLSIRVVLDSACVGVSCGAGETCVGGMCVAVVPDAGTDAAVDSGVDASIDSSVDSAVDSGIVTPTDSGPGEAFSCASSGLTCSAGAELCCHQRADGTGSCLAVGETCVGQPVECADASDCGGGTGVCCARYSTSTGNLQDVRCAASASGCSGPSSQTYEFLCDPAAASPCPTGQACTGTASYTALSWRTCE